MMKHQILVAVIFALTLSCAFAHKYKSGECPNVEPMQNFQMRNFLGIWYAIQKTATGSSCIIYNITQEEPGQYLLQQLSQDYLLGLAPVSHRYSYTGELESTDNDIPAKMKVKFPLNVLPGNAVFKIFITDYNNYAGIFTCHPIFGGFHRQSATILSRTKDIDRAYVDKIRSRLQSYGVNPFDLSIINQSNCPKLIEDPSLNVDITPETFSSQNIGSWIKKAGDKIGDGVTWTLDKTKTIYKKVSGGDSSESDRSSRLTESVTEKPIWMP
jgi:apolipoprotein D and lipocalin family protein